MHETCLSKISLGIKLNILNTFFFSFILEIFYTFLKFVKCIKAVEVDAVKCHPVLI